MDAKTKKLMNPNPKGGNPTIPSWTPSKLGTWVECPRKAWYKFVKKLPEPEAPPLVRGGIIHDHAECYVTGREKVLDKELLLVRETLDGLRKLFQKGLVRTELELSFNRMWMPVHWLSKDVYCRFKLDVAVRDPKARLITVIDWKTGKLKDHGEYVDQLDAYVVAILSSTYSAGMDSAKSKLVFTDCGREVIGPSGMLDKKELAKRQAAWDKKVKPMLVDDRFPATPSGWACRYCTFSQNREGPCAY